VLRDHERCPLRPRLLEYGKDQIGSLPAAAGVIFDDLLRRRLRLDLSLPERDEDVAWISPLILPQARVLGKRLYQAYLRSGAYDALLSEDVRDPDPPRAWRALRRAGPAVALGWSGTEEEVREQVRAARDEGAEAYVLSARLDGLLDGPGVPPKGEGPPRVIDYKTTGVLRGASVPGGYVRRWRGGVNLGGDQLPGPPVGRPGWHDQLGFYAAMSSTHHVGVEAVVVGRGWRTVDVASYRWDVASAELLVIVRRYLEAARSLAGPCPTVEAGARCWAYNRLCRAADRCPARGGEPGGEPGGKPGGEPEGEPCA